jgi:hypothetical protein
MSNLVRPPFVVHVPMPAGERFAIIFPEAMIARTFPPLPGEQWPDAMRRYLQTNQLFTEAHVRTRLAEMGLDETAVAMQIQRARKLTQFNELTSWDHVTTIGFRNREGQQVIRKTEREGSAGQRIFILHCTVCDHEYGANGADIYHRLCPKCQDGPEGFPT